MNSLRPLLSQIGDKLRESAGSILPVAAIIAVLGITLTPLSTGTMLLFLLGVVCLVVGMSVFTLGAEMSMQTIGYKIGTSVAASGKVWIIAFVSFVIGVAVTLAEPDLSILADQVGTRLILYIVSAGVGLFLLVATLRTVFGISLRLLLLVFYAAAFALAFVLYFTGKSNFLPLSFDSGGVTTGPMTVPFLMSFGAGLSAVRGGDDDNGDSFGMTALASVGPIISVLLLGIFTNTEDIAPAISRAEVIEDSREGMLLYLGGFADAVPEVAKALLPMIAFTLLYQLLTRAFGFKQLIRVLVGQFYVFLGLSVFLTGANVGFMPTGTEIGQSLAETRGGAFLVPVAILLGYFIVKAEPAVYVLNKLVEQMSAGAISGKTTAFGLSVGVAAALGLSGLRILTGIHILWVLIPGYLVALGLTFFVPKVFVGIAFDSGGVASGTMMSAFVLPLAIGATEVLGGDVLLEAFGCVAFVAMAPIIAIEVCGLLYKLNSEKNVRRFVSVREDFVDYGYTPRTKKEVATK